ncbi:MAG: hypothetical protein KGJ62_02090 [Armatimonadetes bacterium]|nr:hypothetical protein [Armatimonadota bacterium]MDE2206093.1 hypothetical protein [Armatimonadota bacterium]
MRLRIVTLVAAIAVAAIGSQLRTAAQQPLYSVININPAGSTHAYATGVNDDYQVVGNDSFNKGFLWMPGVPSYHYDSSTRTSAFAINNLGQIAGTGWNSTVSAAVDPFIWNPATYLGTVYNPVDLIAAASGSGYPSQLLAINDDALAAGTLQSASTTPLGFDGFDINTAIGSYFYYSTNVAFTGTSNVLEDVCGVWEASSPYSALFARYGQAGHNLPGETLGAVTYANPSGANGIDDSDAVVGYENNSVSGESEAFAWDGITLAVYGPLGFLPHTVTSTARAINTASGFVVGQSGLHAFLWSGDITNPSNGSMTDLNSLVENNSGWRLVSATALNDYGAIVGYGYYQQKEAAFLAIPVIINSLTTDSPSVVGGNTIAGTVTLDAPAPFDMSVTVTTYNAKVNFGTGIYSTAVLIYAGQTSGRFVAHSTSVTVDTPVTLKATFGGWRRYANIDLIP